jgi:EAL domain-containing protein (putative c-di-GMP-specific phosphodiesterase class I)
MSVVAEGIENEDEAQLMINAGCNELQGYYFSRPVAVAAIDAFFAVPAHEQDLDVRRIGRA